MTYMPLAGSKTAKAIEFIRAEGNARTNQIAAAAKIDKSSVSVLLKHAVEHGILVVCKVKQPGGPDTNEYRIGSGMPPIDTTKEFKPPRSVRRQPQAGSGEVSKNPGSVPSVSSSENPLAEGHAVAEKAPEPEVKRRGMGPASPRVSACDEITILLSSSGTLDIVMPEIDGLIDSIQLTPAQTLALGDFLHLSEGIWRP